MKLTDAAVQAALKEWHDAWNENSNMDDKLSAYAMKEALTAALSYLQPVDVAAVRRRAFEEAATLIDEGFEKAVGKPWRNDGKSSKNDRCPHDKFMYEDCENCASSAIRALSAEPTHGDQPQPIVSARPLDEWHEDYGDVVWWAWDDNKKEWFGEAPFISHPLSSDWPDYHTHWTPLPNCPAAPTTEVGR